MAKAQIDLMGGGGSIAYANVDTLVLSGSSSQTYTINATKNYMITFSDTDSSVAQARSIVWEYKLGTKNVIKAGSGSGITLSDSGLTLTFHNYNGSDKAVAMVLYD